MKNTLAYFAEYFVEYCELLLKFWTKFAQLLSLFCGMNEK